MDGGEITDKKAKQLSEPSGATGFILNDTAQSASSAHLKTTLYNLAEEALEKRRKTTGEPHDQVSIFHELNRIMALNGYPDAHLGHLSHVSDKNLPRAWNNVSIGQKFELYDQSMAPQASAAGPTSATDKARRLAREIAAETSTPPVQPGEGYYQVVRRMHPDLPGQQASKEAHRIKDINKRRDVLIVGERLPTATEAERARELQRRLEGEVPVAPVPGSTRKPESPIQARPVQPAPFKPAPLGPEAPAAGGTKPSKTEPPAAVVSPVTMSMDRAYAALKTNYDRMQSAWSKEEQTQGFIGKAVDAAKNHLGTSGDGRSWYDPRRLWSNVLDSDLGSRTVQERLNQEGKQLESLHLAVIAHDDKSFRTGYKALTGANFDPANLQGAQLHGNDLIVAFDKSQKSGVDTATDVASALAAVISLKCKGAGIARTLGKATTVGALIGGTTKAGLMQADGKYADLPRDFAMGSIMGGSVPLSELAGSQVSRFAGKKLGLTVADDGLLTARIETQGVGLRTRLLSAALKSGTAGAVFGAIESPSRESVNDIETGKPIKPIDLAGLTIKGAAFGFVGGTVLGGFSDRVTDSIHGAFPGKVVMPHKTIGGVDVPSSGTVGIEEAAKILKVKPADFLAKATQDPFGAVKDAVRLYEQTGLNIQKVDPLTGKPLLTAHFSDALSTVQNVELLTSETGVKLAKKVEVVQSTDAFIKENPAAVEDPLKRLTNDPKYKKVVRLKGESGQDAADAFEEQFRLGFEKDLKTTMSVERVKDGSLSEADALSHSTTETEAAYKQKAADFFKDMTDPKQRQRLNTLVDGIYDKFNPELVSREQLRDILDGVPKKDRPLAVALLHESAGNSSDTVLTARLKSLRTDIEAQIGSYNPDNVYTLAPNSSGNLLGYLYRKSNSMSMSMHNIDNLATKVQSGNIPKSVVLFDDIASTNISPATRDLLKKIPQVYVVDLGAFEKSVNIIDYSKGPQAVATKLNQLLDEARIIKGQNSKLLPTAVARQTLSGAVDDVASGLGPNVKIIRPTGHPNIKYQAAAPTSGAESSDGTSLPPVSSVSSKTVNELYAQLNVPKAGKDEIAGFLAGYAGLDRELAARMIAEGAVHNSFPVMLQKAVDLHQGVEQMLQAKGLNMDDLVMVSDKDPGGSSHLVTYLFGTANGLGEANFVSSQQLDNLLSSGAARNKVLAYFDDTIYSGSQTAGMLDANVSSLSPFKRVVVAGLGSYEKGVARIKSTHLAQLGKVDVASPNTHVPFYSNQHPFYSKLPTPQQATVKTIGGSDGFGTIQGSVIWPYMYPDNNIDFFGAKFSGGVLHLPGP